MKLDAKSVAALKLGGKADAIHFDEAMAGFGYRLRLGAGGKVLRSWIAQYKRAGATRRITLGSAEVLGAEAARAAAKKVLAKVALGEDPQNARRDRRDKDALTMRGQVAEYLAVKQGELADCTFGETKRYLADPRYFGPLHKLPIDAIHRKDIAARTVVIMRERGGPTAARARGSLGSFFTWAMKMGLCESNPIIGSVAPAEGGGRDRVLSDFELAMIWRACADDDHGRIIKLLACTGCRRAEIGDMAWSELDDPERPTTFTIPAARTKNGRQHVLPVMPMMRDIIAGVPRMVSRDQLFGQRSHGFTRWAKAKAKLDARSGVKNWVVHDVRRTVATRMADIGTQPHVIECILNHSGGFRSGVAAVYNKSPYANEVRAALAAWEDHIRVLAEGGERKILQLAK
jgi:integrase